MQPSLSRRLLWAWRLRVWPWSQTAICAASWVALNQKFTEPKPLRRVK
jgi:hypothetical protein